MRKILLSVLPVLGLGLAQIQVKHELGTLSLNAPAKRVVVLEYSFLDTLLALGVTPVGAATGTQGGDRGLPPYLRARAEGVTSIGSRAQPSLEAILSVRPEVIIADAFVHRDLIPQLQRIAPVVAFQSRRGSFDDLSQQVLDIGRMVGKEAQARQLLEDQERLLQKARAFANPKAPPLMTAVSTPNSFTVHSNESFIGSLLERLGRKNLARPQNNQTQYELSLEGLVALNPATLVVFTAPDETPIVRSWARNPLWTRLEAVRRGRVFEFDRDNWTRGRGPLATRFILAELINSGLLADKPASGSFALKAP
ncbi:MAG: ABC transporter substrate-binding protein [Meiothermus sp.]|uniref:ABC transporter substrate-binding protein n=1 Tax=Meiothermus sp. TaxID=1955249 RepID=UPI00298EF0FC|nr:ABC transporter substrate-binding protein [Meiothermus sp.]MDW8426211.1 ABC transporter substrate-binding protein [Meiothermus sp.]